MILHTYNMDIVNAFINCQFLYALIIWMFADKRSISEACKIHFRTLQIVYDIDGISYEKLPDDVFSSKTPSNFGNRGLKIFDENNSRYCVGFLHQSACHL